MSLGRTNPRIPLELARFCRPRGSRAPGRPCGSSPGAPGDGKRGRLCPGGCQRSGRWRRADGSAPEQEKGDRCAATSTWLLPGTWGRVGMELSPGWGHSPSRPLPTAAEGPGGVEGIGGMERRLQGVRFAPGIPCGVFSLEQRGFRVSNKRGARGGSKHGGTRRVWR